MKEEESKNYKETLNLPRTDFPMKANLSKKEPEIQRFWEKANIYEKMLERNRGKESFVLHDGPPYANGDIHLGTALNKILKDIIIKYKTMKGFFSPYVPGWDCHGQPIEHEVEKRLGKDRNSLDKMGVRRKCHEYAMHYMERQSRQFRRLGVTGDFRNPYLTLKPEYEATNIRIFAQLFQKGLIYRGRKPIHWCPNCMTALAEAEIEYAEKTSPSIYVKFPVKEGMEKLPVREDGVSLVIWTTTPWTLPANVAIALHPKMEYALVQAGREILVVGSLLLERVMEDLGVREYKKLAMAKGEDLAGIKAQHPWDERLSQVVTAEYVNFQQGTGAVHIAPGHGYEDYQVGLEYQLPMPMPVDDQGIFTEEAPLFQGLFVEEANQAIIDDLKGKGLLLASGKVTHSYPHCWRCKKHVIFRATPQWFIAVDKEYSGKTLRQRAMDSLHQIQWIPLWNYKRMLGMLEMRPDWCISRQRAWGVPIPVFYCKSCGEPVVNMAILGRVEEVIKEKGSDSWFQMTVGEILGDLAVCEGCGSSDLEKGEDILDVWFESGISHEAVLKEREGLTWPCDMYLEGSDQHRGWFQTSLLTAIGSAENPPYRSVLTHGFVVDGEGRKMSKSLGNVISPLETCDQLGADVLRLWVAAADYTIDIPASHEIFQRLVEAYRRIRNTVRFMLGNLYDFDPSNDAIPKEEMEEVDRWILSRLQEVLERVSQAYESYQLHVVYQSLHHFCAVELSSLYLDIRKDCLYTFRKSSRERRSSQTAMYKLLRTLLAMISPILPHTAEEAWQALNGNEGGPTSVLLMDWPSVEEEWKDHKLMEEWKRLLELREQVTKELERMRSAKEIGTSLEASVKILAPPREKAFLEKKIHLLPMLFITSQVELVVDDKIDETMIMAFRARGERCQRCWNYRESVGRNEVFPELCDRCVDAISGC